MTRTLLLSLLLAVLALPVLAQPCDLQMTATCNPGGACTATTTNAGSRACTGLYYVGWISSDASASGSLSGTQNSLGLDECIDSSFYPPGTIAQPFSICFGEASLAPHASFTSSVRVHGANANVPLVAMTYVADEDEELAAVFAYANVDVPSCKPRITAPPLTQTLSDYTVSWSGVADPSAQFVIDESTTPDFTANVTSTTVDGLSKTFRHEVSSATTYYYRVRPEHCAGGTATYSEVASTVVEPPPPTVRDSGEAAVPLGSTTPIEFRVFIPGSSSSTISLLETGSFTATTDKPFLSVNPPSGPLPPEGTTVTVTANPTGLPPGANTGTLKVNANGATTSIPISISLVTPVEPGTKSIPPPNALVIPVITHVQGGAGPFLSDVRLTNASSALVKYQITMTPTETDATKFSKVTQVEVEPQQTVALNDIVKNFFGYGAVGDAGFGALEIRPLNNSTAQTYASSRTYASTAAGTFGQYIAAIPFGEFITRRTSGFPIPGQPVSSAVMSLQQIAHSAKFRTNFGLVEGAGEPASGRVRIFDDAGTMLKELPFELKPGEHKQMNGYLRNPGGITTLEDGRIEVHVDSPTGAVTAYASVLDNITTDPLAVMPVEVSKVSATRYVLPGIAELPGENNFHSDIRVFNGGASDVVANFTYYPFNNEPAISVAPRTIKAGHVLAIDNVLPAMFNHSGSGGSIVVTTSGNSSLVTTARTYTNVAGGGTYGQFIPGVTPAEGIGLGEKPLQVLQLEQSDRFRSNLGIAELTGNPVEVRVSMHFPDTKVTGSTTVNLRANEFVQLNQVIRAFFTAREDQTYNGRVTVEVVSGSGRVTAYGSVIDNKSKDPTYVPAKK